MQPHNFIIFFYKTIKMDSKNTDEFIKKIKILIHHFNKNIKPFLNENTSTTYNYKSDIMDGLLYLLLNTQKNNTHLNSAINISKFNKICVSRQALDKRCKHITLEHINKINNDFYEIFLKDFADLFNHTDGLNVNVYDVDNNKGYKTIKLLTIVNDKNLPRDLHINKDMYKSEIKLFYDCLEKGNYDLKNILF